MEMNPNIAERERQIKEISDLWRTATGTGLREFDRALQKKFQTDEGRNSLTFASIKIVRDGLLKLIKKEKTNENNKQLENNKQKTK